MARNGGLTAIALLVAVLVATMALPTTIEAAERNGKTRCTTECYFECTQIKIFSEEECREECVLACARQDIKKASLEENVNKFIPLWI